MQILFTLFAIALIPTICTIIYLRVKNKVLLAIVGFGALAWLIALIRSPILQVTYFFAGSPSTPPMWFIGFSAILAGVFEESFRYIFLSFCVKDRTWHNGVAFGLGAGLLEIILFYCIGVLIVASSKGLPSSLLDALPGAVARNFAVCIHIGCALLVMHSLRRRWVLGAAIVYHSLVDFIVPLAGCHYPLTVWQVESILGMFALIGLSITYIEKQVLIKTIEVKGEKKRVSLAVDLLGAGFRYRKFVCPYCGYIVEISSLKRVLGPHGLRSHYLKCPRCDKGSWMKIDEESYPEVK